MPFSGNAFTNSWLENTYATPIFASVDFDDFDAAIGSSDPLVNQWATSYMQQQLLLDTSASPASGCEILLSPVFTTPQSILTRRMVTQSNAFNRRSSSIDSEDTPSTPFTSKQQQHQHQQRQQTKPNPNPKRIRPSSKRLIKPTKRKPPTPASPSRKNTANRSPTPTVASRTPHNQVERKYRESLNTEMERLRLALPATTSYSQADRLKLSKAMVLAGAISYIRALEREVEELRTENAGVSCCGG